MTEQEQREERGRRYCQLMGELKLRLWHIGRRVRTPDESFTAENEAVIELELVMLQLRKVLELIAFASLLVNKEAVAAQRADFANMQKAKRILSALEKINPHFFPRAVTISTLEPGRHHIDFRQGDDMFTKDEFAPLFDACSTVLHVMNPFADHMPVVLGRPVDEWAQRIRTLLGMHMIVLSSKQRLLVDMLEWEHAEVRLSQMEAKPLPR